MTVDVAVRFAGSTRRAASAETNRRQLLRAYRESGDRTARDSLVEEFMPLVRSLARRYAGRGEPIDDLEQVGAVGLIKAIERFDLDRDVEVVTYVFPLVLGELKRHFRDRAWSVKVPRRLKELHHRLSRLVEERTATLGRSPTVEELAEAANVDREDVLEALDVGRAYSSRSLSLTSMLEGEEGGDAVLGLLDDEEPGYEAAETRQLLAAGLRTLDERERRIIGLRFVEGWTQSQIAVEVGVSQMHVSRLIRRALERLSQEIEGP